MLSKKTKYALQSLLYLAKKYDKGPVIISDMAKCECLPQKFLEAILLELKKDGFLHSKKGKGGGYYLAKPPKDIILGHVIRLLNGPLAPIACVSQTAYKRCEDCKDENSCGIRMIMKDVRDAIANILDNTSLADLLDRVKKVTEKETSMYFI